MLQCAELGGLQPGGGLFLGSPKAPGLDIAGRAASASSWNKPDPR